MPVFNKNRYITDDSYEIPWRSLRGSANAEGAVRNHLQIIEEHGYAEWDEHATITDVTITGMEGYTDVEEMVTRSKGRTILVEGVTPNEEEIVFLKHVRPSGASSSYIYVDGERFSPRQITQGLKSGDERYKKYWEDKEARQEKKLDSYLNWRYPRIKTELDWS